MPEDARAALEKLRRTIKAAAPKGTQGIGYQIPTFYHQGPLVAFGAAKSHLSFYVTSPAVMEAQPGRRSPLRHVQGPHPIHGRRATPRRPGAEARQARIAENEAGVAG